MSGNERADVAVMDGLAAVMRQNAQFHRQHVQRLWSEVHDAGMDVGCEPMHRAG